MSAKYTGGPAYPMGHTESAMYASCMEDLANPAIDDAERAHLWAKAKALCGLTRRDYFAAKAMQGLLAQSMGMALGVIQSSRLNMPTQWPTPC